MLTLLLFFNIILPLVFMCFLYNQYSCISTHLFWIHYNLCPVEICFSECLHYHSAEWVHWLQRAERVLVINKYSTQTQVQKITPLITIFCLVPFQTFKKLPELLWAVFVMLFREGKIKKKERIVWNKKAGHISTILSLSTWTESQG